MEQTNVFSGKTVEEAVETGLKELGVTREEVEIAVLEEGKKKLFGSVPAQVQLTVKPKKTDGERAVDFLEGLFALIGVEAVPTIREEDERIVVDLATAEPGKGLIGRRGEMIDAIQTLAGAVANMGRRDYKRVVVDCGNYREDREETLKRVAEKLAQKAVRLGKRVRLEPMNPYERRIIHSALVDSPDVTTKSEGKEPARYVVIIPNNMRPYEKRDRYGKDRNRYNDRDRRGGRDGKYGERKNDRYGDRKPYPKRELPAEDTPQSSGTSLSRGGTAGYKKGGFSGFFGTYLGNSRDSAPDSPTPAENGTPETPDEE